MPNQTYTCPMHPEVTSDKPGHCPKCGMELVAKSDANHIVNPQPESSSYMPLLTIIGLILLVIVSLSIKDLQVGTFSFAKAMTNFMAGFFLVFSGFKLLDIKGFAEGYYTYDLLARRFFNYGYIYPFIELGLGLSYLTRFMLPQVNLVTLIVMTLSSLGVLNAISKKRKIQCACLGTVIKLPLTYVTLVEDLGMAAMALVGLVAGIK